MAYIPLTIKQKGLRQHLTDLGLDYDLYRERLLEGQKPAAIALALSARSGKPVTARTVRAWQGVPEFGAMDNT